MHRSFHWRRSASCWFPAWCLTDVGDAWATARAGQLSLTNYAAATVCVTNSTSSGTGGCPKAASVWQKAPASWPAPYTSGQTIGSVFTSAPWSVASSSLQDALDGKTGDKSLKELLKQATAALLNAASPNIDYPFTVAEVVQAVNTALSSYDDQSRKELTTLFKEANEVACP